MEVILSTAFGVKGETQTVENDPITELAKKAMAAHPLVGIMCKEVLLSFCISIIFFPIHGVSIKCNKFFRYLLPTIT